jgi:hypothetical protein
MLRLVSKLQAKFKKVRKKLGPIFPIVFVGLLGAVSLWGIGKVLDLFWLAPSVTISDPTSDTTWVTISPAAVTAISGFLFGATIGIWYFAYLPNKERIHGHWAGLPIWVRSTTLGLCGSILMTFGLLVVHTLWGLSDLAVFFGFLVSWPSITAMALLQQRCIDGECPRTTAMFVGYTHAKGLESRTLAIIIGSIVGVLGSLLTWVISVRIGSYGTAIPAAVVGLLFWVGSTIVVYNRYEKQTAEQADLSIIEINRSETQATWELRIRNESNEIIDLSLAKIRDTKLDIYTLGVDRKLGPGEVCTFNAPEQFRLGPNDESWELPLGYTLKQGSEMPAILTQSGGVYRLQTEKIDTEQYTPDDAEIATNSTPNSGGNPDTTPSPQD